MPPQRVQIRRLLRSRLRALRVLLLLRVRLLPRQLRPPSHVIARRVALPTYNYHARITVPAGFMVANGGELLSQRDSAGWTTFEFSNLKPAWRIDFAVAPFTVRRKGRSRSISSLRTRSAARAS